VTKFSLNDYVECKRVAIELLSLCNRDCSFCQRFNDRSGVRKDRNGKSILDKMPTKHVYSIIDQLAALGFKRTVLFHGFSEPTLDSRLPEFVTYAKEKGMKVRITTNGDVLRVNNRLCSQLDGLVDVFKISLYDYTTHKEKVESKKYWQTRITKSRITFGNAVEDHYHRDQSKLLPSELSNQTQAELPCLRTHGLYIRYDGEVGLCCLDDHRSFNLGNAFETTVEEIWWSDRRIQIANSLKESGSRNKYNACANCYYMPEKNFSFREKTIKRTRRLLFRFGLNPITEKGL